MVSSRRLIYFHPQPLLKDDGALGALLTSIGTEYFLDQVLWRHPKGRLRNPFSVVCCGMGQKNGNATVLSISGLLEIIIS